MAERLQALVQSPDSFWDQNQESVEAFLVYAAGILVYALVVNAFYQLMSKRVMFASGRGSALVHGTLNGLGYYVLLPLVSFAFFITLCLSLLFLGGPEQPAVHVITLSFALVAAVRIAAYFSEPTSHDVAKMLPLGVLGAVVAQSQFSTLAQSASRMADLFDHPSLIGFYFLVVVLLEFLLRSIYLLGAYERRSRHALPDSFRRTMKWCVIPFP